ncbi:MAG: PD40 domain-containing protein [Caldilineaceae bacterium]|nr:PD40 domain-containing protein [Caldilineaceae bacterium]
MRRLTGRFPTWALWLCTAITFLAGVLLILAIVLGVRAGQQQVEIKRRQQIGATLQLALAYHAQGQTSQAQSAYEAVLVLDPTNNAALEGLNQLRQFGGLAGPVIVATPDPNRTNTGVPTDTAPSLVAVLPTAVPSLQPSPTPALAELMTQAEAAYSAGRWSESIESLLGIRRLDATYATARIDELLFTAYINLATEKDNQNKLEEALGLYDKALALQPNAAEIRRERQLIAQYLDILTYSGADWERSATLLRMVYAQEPDYRDVKTRLQQALVAYGKEQGADQAWCDAAALLTEAIAIAVTPGVIAQRDEYQAVCDDPVLAAALAATAANTTTVTGTTDALVDATVPTGSVDTGAAGSLSRGSILYSAVDATSGRSRVLQQLVNSTASPTLVREDAAQPSMRQDGQRLVFRNMRNDMAGLSAWDPATDLLLRFTNYAEDMLPTWGPQSNRLAFASNREGDRIWRIYTTWADGNSDDVMLSIGEAPDWHPTQDVIAFRGCDDTGNRCGIWTIDSAGGNRAPLTTVSADNRPTWSPDGRYVVFMSDGRDGSFELYRVDTAGQVLRLTNSPSIDVLPAVSPDGRWVAFISNREGSWKLFAVPMGGGATVPIAPILGNLDNWLNHDIQWIP